MSEEALELHRALRGKLSIIPKQPLRSPGDLSLLYTPGVAAPCLAIAENKDLVHIYTGKGNLVAVISDGSAVLGLGNIGPEAGLPVMEGKSLLFKAFAGVDSVPLVLNTQDPEKIIAAVEALGPSFGGINLEDISAPRCFEIERALKAKMDIPVFHDDQHGTAVVVLAGLLNALKKTGRSPKTAKVVLIGAGAAGTAISRILLSNGFSHLTVCDKKGILHPGMDGISWAQEELAQATNPSGRKGSLADALLDADVFIGVSGPGILTPELIQTMAKGPIVFALANPQPEISEKAALDAGAAVVATGRSDATNQVNNVLAFPGIFRGALDVRASDISEGMKLAAAKALAAALTPEQIQEGKIIPSPFTPGLTFLVAMAVAKAAMDENLAREPIPLENLEKLILSRIPTRVFEK